MGFNYSKNEGETYHNQMNELIFFLGIIAVFSCVVLVGKYFGESGLVAWVAVSTILANIILPKQIHLLGLDVTLGNIMFSSTYLCTDILSEKVGIKSSRRAVYVGLVSALFFVGLTQVALLFVPNEYDYAQGAMQELFAFSARVTLASMVMYFLANMCDVYLFEGLRKKFPKQLWLRNNISTILCNCVENFGLMLLGFWGIYDFKTCMVIAAGTCVIETVVGLCDTPFVYIGRKVFDKPRETAEIMPQLEM